MKAWDAGGAHSPRTNTLHNRLYFGNLLIGHDSHNPAQTTGTGQAKTTGAIFLFLCACVEGGNGKVSRTQDNRKKEGQAWIVTASQQQRSQTKQATGLFT